jgi:hypothetical protein
MTNETQTVPPSTDLTAVTATVDAYLATWNETDATRRAEMVERTWVQDGRYVDPLLEATGHAELTGLGAVIHEHYPGHVLRRTSGVDLHHDQVRFGWELVDADGHPVLAGIDFGRVAPEGRLQAITGCFEDLPSEG